MIAGTLAQYTQSLDDPLEDYIRDNGGLPTVTITTTQSTTSDATPQTGTVAGRITDTHTDVYTGTDQDGDPYIETDRVESVDVIATDWYADVTDSGVVLAESIAANEELPFPFDVLAGITANQLERRQIDIEAVYDAWRDADASLDLWMAGNDERGSQMAYHGHAQDVDPTIGLGFKRAWNGTTIKGVAWAGGYIALYSARHAADGLAFVRDELLPYTESWDPEEHEEQTDFDEFGGGE